MLNWVLTGRAIRDYIPIHERHPCVRLTATAVGVRLLWQEGDRECKDEGSPAKERLVQNHRFEP